MMSLRSRITYELVKPRESKLAQFAIWGLSGLVVVWGFAVCLLITGAIIAAIAQEWF
jgi:hypothetical protein